MPNLDTLNAALEKFPSWGRPWEFQSWVEGALSEADKKAFAAVWDEATAARHWSSADLGQCAQRPAAALRERFPGLSPEAAAAAARAAAYEWR